MKLVPKKLIKRADTGISLVSALHVYKEINAYKKMRGELNLQKHKRKFWEQYILLLKAISVCAGCVMLTIICLHSGTAYGNNNSFLMHTVLVVHQSRYSLPSSVLTPTPNSPSIYVSTQPDYINYGLQAAYDFLTLLLVGVSIWAIFVSRKQAQDALTTAREQIKKSEKQAQDALTIAREQIEKSEKQALETIYNQVKPVLVCTGHPTIVSSYIKVDIENDGLGVATNIWGYISYRQADKSHHQYQRIDAFILAASQHKTISFTRREPSYKLKEIENYSFFPVDTERISYEMRIIMTYYDIFDHKHLSVFDFSNTFGWKQITLKSNINQTLEEMMSNEHEI